MMVKENKDYIRVSKFHVLIAVLIALIVLASNLPSLWKLFDERNEIKAPQPPLIRNEVISTSLVSIIANPEAYAGKRVSFIGYLKMGFEEKGLYLSADDAHLLNANQALWFGGLKEGFDWSKAPGNGYVSITGTLQYSASEYGYGHLGNWFAELVEVENISSRNEMFQRRVNETKNQNQSH